MSLFSEDQAVIGLLTYLAYFD